MELTGFPLCPSRNTSKCPVRKYFPKLYTRELSFKSSHIWGHRLIAYKLDLKLNCQVVTIMSKGRNGKRESWLGPPPSSQPLPELYGAKVFQALF